MVTDLLETPSSRYSAIKKLMLVLCLGFSSGLPLALVGSTLQAWFAVKGMSLWATGLLSFASFPYVYRFLWSPLLDVFGFASLGKRRGWILLMQGLLCLGFNLMSWLSPNVSPMAMGVLAFMLAGFSATQDTAIDAHRIDYLNVADYGLGASFATTGYRLAMLVSGGLALIMADLLGWAYTYRFMGIIVLLLMIITYKSSEPHHSFVQPKIHSFAELVRPLTKFLQRKNTMMLLLFVMAYGLGHVFTNTTSGIVMPFLIQGKGYSLMSIAYVNKLLGIFAIIAGGFVGGLLLKAYRLYPTLMVFGWIQALSNVLFVFLALADRHIWLLALAVIADNFASGLTTTALVVFLMRTVDKDSIATQFSFLIAFSALPRILSGPLGVLLEHIMGWVGLYVLSVILALIFIPCIRAIREDESFV